MESGAHLLKNLYPEVSAPGAIAIGGGGGGVSAGLCKTGNLAVWAGLGVFLPVKEA